VRSFQTLWSLFSTIKGVAETRLSTGSEQLSARFQSSPNSHTVDSYPTLREVKLSYGNLQLHTNPTSLPACYFGNKICTDQTVLFKLHSRPPVTVTVCVLLAHCGARPQVWQ
jgi:hypothetical protein